MVLNVGWSAGFCSVYVIRGTSNLESLSDQFWSKTLSSLLKLLELEGLAFSAVSESTSSKIVIKLGSTR